MKLFRSFTTALAFAGALATAQPIHAGSGPTDEELAGMFAFALGAIVLMGIASSANQARDRQETPPHDRDRGWDRDRNRCQPPAHWMRVPKHGGGTERLCVIPTR